MVEVVTSVSAMSYFVPIFAFFLVFIIVYALLKKTGVLGDNEPIMLFVSFILASFFIMEASLAEFVRIGSAWFGVIVFFIFFVVALIAFGPGKDKDNPLAVLVKGNWFAWMILGLVFALFIFSAAHVFNFVTNWETVGIWANSDWFGLVLIILLAFFVSFVIKTKK